MNSEWYEKAIQEEACAWSAHAIKKVPGKLGVYTLDEERKLLRNKIYRNEYIEKTLSLIKSDIKALELGCASGDFSIEMWRRGANVDAIDIAKGALDIGKRTYEELKKTEPRTNTIRFIKHDINNISQFLDGQRQYDVIVIRNVMHHLVNLESVLDSVYSSMHDESLLVIDDSSSYYIYQDPINAVSHLFLSETLRGIYITFRSLFKIIYSLLNWKYAHSIVQCHGSTPFESITSGQEIEKTLLNKFRPVKLEKFAAFIGSITCPFESYPFTIQRILTPILSLANKMDKMFIRLKIACGSVLWGVFSKPKI